MIDISFRLFLGLHISSWYFSIISSLDFCREGKTSAIAAINCACPSHRKYNHLSERCVGGCWRCLRTIEWSDNRCRSRKSLLSKHLEHRNRGQDENRCLTRLEPPFPLFHAKGHESFIFTICWRPQERSSCLGYLLRAS